MIDSLLYVSRRSPTDAHDDAVLEAIELVSLSRNSTLDLTGALIATPSHFAQFLEGDSAALDAVMRSIRTDARHSAVMVADAPVAGRRLFPAWRMACFGPGNFMSRHIAPMLDRHPARLSPTEAGAMIALMTQLVADNADKAGQPRRAR